MESRDNIFRILRQFRDKYGSRYEIIEIGVFGSVARGETNDSSDIDIVVKLEKQDLFNLIGIKQDLEDIFHRCVDVVSYRNDMNKFLKSRIEKEVIYV